MATSKPSAGEHYYLADAATPTVMRYVGPVKGGDGQGVLMAGDDIVVADIDNLVRVPTTSTDVVTWLKKADKALAAGDVETGRQLLGSVLQWALGIPAES